MKMSMQEKLAGYGLTPVDIGSTGSKYIIPPGVCGNTTGYAIEVVIPHNVDASTMMLGQIDGGGKNTWSGIESSFLNNNENVIAVKLRQGASISSSGAWENAGNLNMQMLDVVSNLTGIEEASVAGASNGAIFALATGAASANGNYGIKVVDVAWVDYANPNGVNISPLLSSMARDGITLTGITDTDYKFSSGTGKAISMYSQMGGNARTFLYKTGYDHDSKCRHGTLGFVGIENGYEFYEYRTYENGVEKVELYAVAKENIERITAIPDMSYVSVEYNFAYSNVHTLKRVIKRCNIQNVGDVTNETGGASTFVAANVAFNEYAKNSTQFLDKLNFTYDNILKISECMYDQDRVLSNSIGGTSPDKYLAEIVGLNIESLDSFFKNTPQISSINSSGNLKITRAMLLEAISDGNIIVSSITQDIEDTRKIQGELDSFISESKQELVGPIWDEIRKKLNEYSDVCDTKISYAESLLDAMKDAYVKLLDYLGDYNELDYSKLPEVIDRIDKARTDLEALKEQHGKPIYNDATGKIEGYIDNSAQIAMLEEVIAMLNEWKGKLEGLPAKDENSSNIISSAGAGGSAAMGLNMTPSTTHSSDISTVQPTVPNSSGDINEPINNTNVTTPIYQNVNNASEVLNVSEEEDLDEFEEDVTEDDEILEEEVPQIIDNPKKNKNIFGKLGKLIGIGGAAAAVGAGGYAIKKQSEKNNETDE